MTADWIPRYPDLAGKVVVVAGESTGIGATAELLIANHAYLAVVAPSHELVEAITEIADAVDHAVFGLVADPALPATWDRITQHIEQRLGPIDVLVAIAREPTRRVIIDALVSDMAARKRGVIVEVGFAVDQLQGPPGVRYRAIQGDNDVTPDDLAAAVLLCSSDSLAVPSLSISMGQPPG